MLTLTGGMDFREMPSGHALEKPFFRQQRLPGQVIVAQRAGQGFQQPGLLLPVAYPIEQRLLALTEYPFDLPALERLARFQCWRQRPLLQMNQRIADARFTEGIDPHQQGAGVVLAAGQMRRVDQGLRSAVQIRLIAQNRRNGGVAQHGPDAVAEQHEAFVQAQFAIEKIQHQMLIEPQRPLEHMLHARLVPDVILADPLQRVGVPAINPAIADMGQGKTPAAHDQSTDSGEQRLPTAIGLQPAILCQQQAIQRLSDAPGFRRGVVIQRQGLQGRAGGEAAIGALADAVGDGEQITLARRQRRGRSHQAQGVLILLARADGAGFGKTQLQAH